jgi:hypothetical protein
MAIERNRSWTVRTVYLYVATLVGLGLLIAGGVQGFELVLKSTVLKQADAEEAMWAKQPPMPYMLDAARGLVDEDGLTDAEKASVRSWIADYERWDEQRAAYDAVAARRERQLATALALVFVGIPVYLYHWLTIRKELGRLMPLPANET